MDASLARRIELLELEVRRWKVLTAVIIMGMAVLGVAAAAPSQVRVIPEDQFVQQVPAGKLTARDFTLVGKDGTPYARLYTRPLNVTSGNAGESREENQPILEFYDSKGQVIWSAPPSRGGFRPVEVDGR
jgi:hypothetical protein